MVTGEEKEVVVHDVVGGVSNGRNEKREEGSERSRETHRGQHLRNKAEALEYLADLSHLPNLANWLAVEARENEATKLRRHWKSKGDGRVVGIGTSEVSAPENGENRIGVPEEHLQTDASLESEDAKLQKEQKVSEGSSTPIRKDSVSESESETAMAQHPHIDLSKEEDRVENKRDSERTISSEAHRKDIIPAIFEKKADLERAVSLEAQQRDRNDVIPVKLISSPRYLDTKDNSESTNDSSGEGDDNIQNEKQKVCSICGHPGHKWKKCKKVNKCLYCAKKGHLPQDCPRKDVVRERTNLCLKCANPGHDMFSCTNDYPAEDLKKIKCYACKQFGHLCCIPPKNGRPIRLSCYNCGESDHQGPECNKVQQSESRSKRRRNRKKRKKLQEDNGSPSTSVHPNSRDEEHPGQERHKKAKLVR